MPSCFFASLSVRASTKICVASCASVVQIFWPLRRTRRLRFAPRCGGSRGRSPHWVPNSPDTTVLARSGSAAATWRAAPRCRSLSGAARPSGCPGPESARCPSAPALRQKMSSLDGVRPMPPCRTRPVGRDPTDAATCGDTNRRSRSSATAVRNSAALPGSALRE